MDPIRTWAVFRKELIHIRRDPASLIQVILIPVILLLINGYALNFDLKYTPIAVYNQAGGRLSEDLVQRFRASRYFQIYRYVSDYHEISHLLNTRQIMAALIIPYDFSRQLKSAETAQLQLIVDGSNANTANLIIGYAQGIAAAYNEKLLLERLEQRGQAQLSMPLESQPRLWFNEELESRNFIVPGLIAIIMTMVGALLTALCIIREKERGSMEGLMGSPLKKSELIFGKLGPYFFIGMIDMFIAMAMGQLLFEVPFRGNLLLFIGLSALFLVVVLGQGLFISVTSRSQLEAYQMAILTTFLPAFLLSGAIFSIGQMPYLLQLLSYLVPATYLVNISKGIYLKGIGWYILWPDALILIVFALFFLIASGRKFTKKIT
ncbi:ABC transporter permease [Desulfobacca acetoxidans]|uniref:ABC-2 type transporter n=1 Tax=Desulfobacca acetoxidans (strain ATCC 700848 / DSM 11109 / ASRB2) TaxID=880072 RepID=F2NIW8_DESAR|nr:ABC transporter permease [Desulfobacca acetoxidans]AEB10662.1 ABC-2 type transporter [Desulfobacca acetoxidans DSM 11109]